ncbi:YraN family protein [Dehalococcoides mccartyi]|nr:YraN family protein [Dehalococcoides mccartyi]
MNKSTGKLNLPAGIGRAGESAARSFVEHELGYEVLETNFRTREGEIDIVAKSGSSLVFFEVKTRTNKKFGAGVEQISSNKAIRLQTTALRYLEHIDAPTIDWRIDLLSVEMSRSGVVRTVYHIRDAIEDQEQ